MGASTSTQQPPPFETVEAALMAGITQDEIDAWYALHGGNERTMTTSENDDQHLKSSRKMSSKSGSNKTQKTHHEGGGGGGGGSAASTTPLVKTLLKEKGILRKIVEITSVSQTLRLLMTCKELLVAEKDVFENHKLPAVCDMKRGCKEFKLAWKGQRVQAVPRDGRNAKLTLGEVARHVGSGGAEVAGERDGRRNVDHVRRSRWCTFFW